MPSRWPRSVVMCLGCRGNRRGHRRRRDRVAFSPRLLRGQPWTRGDSVGDTSSTTAGRGRVQQPPAMAASGSARAPARPTTRPSSTSPAPTDTCIRRADIVGGLHFTDSGDVRRHGPPTPSSTSTAAVRSRALRFAGHRSGPSGFSFFWARTSYDWPQLGGDFGNWTGVEKITPFYDHRRHRLFGIRASPAVSDHRLDGSFSALHNSTGLEPHPFGGHAGGRRGEQPLRYFTASSAGKPLSSLRYTRFGVDVTQGRQISSWKTERNVTAEGWSAAPPRYRGVSDYGPEFFAQGRWLTVDRTASNDIDRLGIVGSRCPLEMRQAVRSSSPPLWSCRVRPRRMHQRRARHDAPQWPGLHARARAFLGAAGRADDP